MIRRMICVAASATLLCAAATDASIPPPPPPPPDLPQAYDGYATEAMWYAYIYWVRGETFSRREAAFAALRLPGWSEDQTAWRTELDGPSYIATSHWIPYGSHFAFEQVCPVASGYGSDPEGCLWRYRSAFFDAQEGDIHAIVYDTFDGAAFAQYLATQDIGPEAVTDDFRSDFGLAQIVHGRLDALIKTRELREDSCPAVGEAIERLADLSLSLSPYGPPADTPPPPPPAPPGAAREVLTIPAGYYPDTEVRVTFEGNGTGSMRVLVSELTSGLRDCHAGAPE